MIALPVTVDLVLWLGPRLSIETILQRVVDLGPLMGGASPELAEALLELQVRLLEFGQQFNLLALLITAPLGLPSLMAARTPTANPLGQLATIDIGYPWLYLGLTIGFQLAGVLLGAVYFGLVAQQIQAAKTDLRLLAGRLPGLCMRFLMLVFLIGPILIAFQLFAMAVIATHHALAIFGLMVAMWMLTYLVFSPHGVLEGRGAWRSVWDSLRVVQWNLPAVLFLLGLALILYLGLNVLWDAPGNTSWLSLLSIIGHAYVATGLFAGTLVFYRERLAWMDSVRAAAAGKAPLKGQGAQ